LSIWLWFYCGYGQLDGMIRVHEVDVGYTPADSSISGSRPALLLLPIPILRSPDHLVVESDRVCVRTGILQLRNWFAGGRWAFANGITGIIDVEDRGSCLGRNVYLGHDVWVEA